MFQLLIAMYIGRMAIYVLSVSGNLFVAGYSISTFVMIHKWYKLTMLSVSILEKSIFCYANERNIKMNLG